MRARGALCARVVVSLLPALLSAQQLPAPPQQAGKPSADLAAQTPNSALGPISAYLGLPVREIRFALVPAREQDHLRQLLPQKVGQPLNRELVRDSLKLLFDTGLFADVQVESEKTPDSQVILTFSGVNNYFIGSVSAEGDPGRPSANQIVSATKLQLGEIYTPEKLE
ncbi:MAG: POTRA domain-containing protein, partial [Terriglobales bacterium]